jgi:glyoxylase-like metal-dependent hydrolase (beta-lactamase superfamily II)
MVDVSEVAENIYMINDQLLSIPRWGSVYLVDEERKALVDTGPTTSAPAVLDGLRKLDVRPEDIAYIIATHIHLDHAGGVGVLIKHMPQAQVVVHHRGARHLIDPARLVNSSIEARGSEVIKTHGEVLPVEVQRVQPVSEGDTITLGRQQNMKFIETPGHAPHELCIYETRNGGLFTGDAVAAYIPECDILLPFHPPPTFDLQLCLSTLERLEKYSARKIYYAHFGFSDRVQEHLDRARRKLGVWDHIVNNAAREGAFADARARLIEQACTELEPMKGVASMALLYDYMVKIHIPLAADGHIRYYGDTMKLN